MSFQRHDTSNASKSRIASPAAAAILLFLLCFFSVQVSAQSQDTAPRGQPESIRLQLKWRHQFQFAGYYAAIEKGYFRQEGLDVRLIEGSPSIDPSNELLAGRVDYAIDSPAVLIKHQQHKSLVVLAAIFQHSPSIIVTLKKSGLNTPQSLNGKRIMMTPATDPEALAMLLEEGVPEDSLRIIPHSWRIDDLIDGRTDAQTAYLTNEPYLFRQRGVEINEIRPLDYGIDFYQDCIVTTTGEIRRHAERVRKFLSAVNKGWIYALDHPEEIARLIWSRYSKDKSPDQLLFEAAAMRKLIQPDLVEIGHVNPERWHHIADTFVSLKMLKPGYDLSGFLYSGVLEKMDSESHRRVRNIVSFLGILIFLAAFIGLILFVFNRNLAHLVRNRTASLAESEQHFRAFYEMAAVGVAKIGVHDKKYILANKKYCEILGYTLEELQAMTFADFTHPDDVKEEVRRLDDLVAGKYEEFTVEKRYFRKDGSMIWAFLTVSPLWIKGQEPDFVLGVIRDITARKQAEEKLVFASKVFENSIEGIVVTDADGSIMQVNPAFTTITGYTPEEAVGKNPRILKSRKHSDEFYRDMWKRLLESGQWAGEIWNRRKNGEAYPEWLTINAVRDRHGITTNYVSIFHDISKLKQQQEALEHQAQHDALTGLPNRILINDRLEMALARIRRSGNKLALLYLDMDNFKHINDAFGHTAGDNLLIEVAGRLTAMLRTEDTMARLGGDEFLILLSEIEDIDDVSLIAARLIESMKKPFYHEEVEYFITASIGVVIAPEDGTDAVSLVKYADNALYRAKSLGRNNYQFYAPDLDVQAHRRITLEMKMRKALENDDFELHYQPLVRIADGEIVGAEALIRWRDEDRLISPGEFIPLAEDSGLIIPLGEWVVSTAARQAGIWKKAGYNLGISVNISSRQFAGQDLEGLLNKVMAAENLDTGALYLEITESLLMGDLPNAQRIMGSLRQLGMKFYLDDFGTGYSSLSYLKRLPIDGLKIDRSFIRDMAEDPETQAIVAVIISLAQILNLAVVAEGVETREQWTMLNGMGNILMQGYLASRPVTAAEFEKMLRNGRLQWDGLPS